MAREFDQTTDRMVGKLDRIIEMLCSLRADLDRLNVELDTKASAADVAQLAQRVEALPTAWQMIMLVVGAIGGTFLVLGLGFQHLDVAKR